MKYGIHIYQTAPDMDMATMCAYPPSHHALPHCECLLCSFTNHLRIDLPSHESYNTPKIKPKFTKQKVWIN